MTDPAASHPEPGPWVEAEAFHRPGARIYPPAASSQEQALPSVVKRRRQMAHVRYRPAHPCPGAPGWLAGAGAAYSVWLASEQPGTAEGLPTGGLLGAWDTALDPDAAIGWHAHADSTELYLLIGGTLTVRCGPELHNAQDYHLQSGDQHRLPLGWGHAALAGPGGARLIVFELAAPSGPESGNPGAA